MLQIFNTDDLFQLYWSRGRKSLKNQTRDVIKMREMRGEVEKKTPKKYFFSEVVECLFKEVLHKDKKDKWWNKNKKSFFPNHSMI